VGTGEGKGDPTAEKGSGGRIVRGGDRAPQHAACLWTRRRKSREEGEEGSPKVEVSEVSSVRTRLVGQASADELRSWRPDKNRRHRKKRGREIIRKNVSPARRRSWGSTSDPNSAGKI